MRCRSESSRRGVEVMMAFCNGPTQVMWSGLNQLSSRAEVLNHAPMRCKISQCRRRQFIYAFIVYQYTDTEKLLSNHTTEQRDKIQKCLILNVN